MTLDAGHDARAGAPDYREESLPAVTNRADTLDWEPETPCEYVLFDNCVLTF